MKQIGFLLVFGLAVSAAPAHAQIYAWRDANGTLVLSDRPSNPEARTYAVPGTKAIRTSREGTLYGEDIERHIEEQSAAHGVRPDLVRAVIQVESAFNPRARSPKGCWRRCPTRT